MIYLSLCSYELMVYWENVDYLWLKVEWIFLHCYNLVKLFTLWLFVFYSGQSYLTLADERMTLNWMIVYDSKHRTNAVHLSTQWVLSLLDLTLISVVVHSVCTLCYTALLSGNWSNWSCILTHHVIVKLNNIYCGFVLNSLEQLETRRVSCCPMIT